MLRSQRVTAESAIRPGILEWFLVVVIFYALAEFFCRLFVAQSLLTVCAALFSAFKGGR